MSIYREKRSFPCFLLYVDNFVVKGLPTCVLCQNRLVNRIANRDGDAVISSCASRDGQIAMILAIRLVILSLFRAESGHKACL